MKTLHVLVRPIYGARMGLSVRYLYRGIRLHGDTVAFWDACTRDAAIEYARNSGYSRVRFDIADDYHRDPRISIARVSADSANRAPNINALLRANPRPCRYGAPLGAMNRDAAPGHVRRYCQRVRFTDGDYGADGTYWGSGGGPLYAVFTQNLETLCYFRAPNRASAMAQYLGGKR